VTSKLSRFGPFFSTFLDPAQLFQPIKS
jgi:hypothetical protein